MRKNLYMRAFRLRARSESQGGHARGLYRVQGARNECAHTPNRRATKTQEAYRVSRVDECAIDSHFCASCASQQKLAQNNICAFRFAPTTHRNLPCLFVHRCGAYMTAVLITSDSSECTSIDAYWVCALSHNGITLLLRVLHNMSMSKCAVFCSILALPLRQRPERWKF